jgi:hypothetical protein
MILQFLKIKKFVEFLVFIPFKKVKKPTKKPNYFFFQDVKERIFLFFSSKKDTKQLKINYLAPKKEH